MELVTALSRVDGTGGALRYRGHPVHDVATNGLAAALARLWHDRDPDGDEGLGAARAWAVQHLPRVAPALEASDGMDALRGAIGLLPSTVTPTQLVGAMALFGAAWIAGQPVEADPEAHHGTDILRMAGLPDGPRGRALDAYLATVADHGTNASTFAARVVASTGSDAVSAVVAALGALKGPLHGGAPGPVLDMLDATQDLHDLDGWVHAELAAGRRIMGFGHRVYRARDPRAVVLEEVTRTLEPGSGRLAHAARLEQAVARVLGARHPDRVLAANVEFATAVLLEAIGLPRPAFTVAFAMGRVVGWLAHVDEQRETGRLIRPRATYVGR